jgi:hypothetical protein
VVETKKGQNPEGVAEKGNPKRRASVVPSGLGVIKSFPRVPSLRSVTRGYALSPLRGLETSAQSAQGVSAQAMFPSPFQNLVTTRF